MGNDQDVKQILNNTQSIAHHLFDMKADVKEMKELLKKILSELMTMGN